MRRWPLACALLLTIAPAAACRAPLTSPTAPSTTTAGTAAFSAEVGLCVEETNKYRRLAGKAVLQRSGALEEYAAAAARTDGLAHTAHKHAHSTNLGNGTARAENAILWWSVRYYGSVRQVIVRGLGEMWEQGAGGPHYRNLVGAFSEVGCGLFVNGEEVTVVQAFR